MNKYKFSQLRFVSPFLHPTTKICHNNKAQPIIYLFVQCSQIIEWRTKFVLLLWWHVCTVRSHEYTKWMCGDGGIYVIWHFFYSCAPASCLFCLRGRTEMWAFAAIHIVTLRTQHATVVAYASQRCKQPRNRPPDVSSIFFRYCMSRSTPYYLCHL